MFSKPRITLSLLKFFLHFFMVPACKYFGYFFVCLFSQNCFGLSCITIRRRAFFAKQLEIEGAGASRFL